MKSFQGWVLASTNRRFKLFPTIGLGLFLWAQSAGSAFGQMSFVQPTPPATSICSDSTTVTVSDVAPYASRVFVSLLTFHYDHELPSIGYPLYSGGVALEQGVNVLTAWDDANSSPISMKILSNGGSGVATVIEISKGCPTICGAYVRFTFCCLEQGRTYRWEEEVTGQGTGGDGKNISGPDCKEVLDSSVWLCPNELGGLPPGQDCRTTYQHWTLTDITDGGSVEVASGDTTRVNCIYPGTQPKISVSVTGANVIGAPSTYYECP